VKPATSLIAIALAVSAFAAAPAGAEEVPAEGQFDARVRTVQYNPEEVYRLNMALRSAMQITFASDEEVENIALGDSVSWEVAPSGHRLFVKPLDAAPPTNLIVTTTLRTGGPGRVYHFKMLANAPSVAEESGAVFALQFRYPREEALMLARLQEERLAREALAIEAQAVSYALDAAVADGPRNLDYVLAGPADLAPSEVSDNGVSTVLRFPRGQAIPAIYKVLPDGTESLVNFDVRGEFVVIHEVTRQLRLRIGLSLVCIWNEAAASPYGGDTSTGTVSPDVIRETESM